MTPRVLKMEFWLALILASASASFLGFLLLAVARHRFPEMLSPFVDVFFGTKENAAVAADLGIKLGMASVLGLIMSLGCLAHYVSVKRKVSNAA